MRLKLLIESNFTLERLYSVLAPYDTQHHEQWISEVKRLMNDDNKRIKTCELMDRGNESYRNEGSRIIRDGSNLLDEWDFIKGQIESLGFSYHLKRNAIVKEMYDLTLAMNDRDLKIWLDLGLTTGDGGGGHPFLSGWMLGFSTKDILWYYCHDINDSSKDYLGIKNRNREEMMLVLEKERELAKELDLPYE